MATQAESTRIAICIVTRQRPKGLARTLASLEQLVLPPNCIVEVIVVDNDDPDAANETPLAPIFGRPVHRVAEPRQGIPFARNRALDEARSRADFLAFIDDDETVDPGWLKELLAVQEAHQVDIVTGPALPKLPEQSPSWATRSGAYDCHRYQTGQDRPWAFTHNVLARTSLFDDREFRFDEEMRYTGGSDTELFRKLQEAGHRIVWADEAIAWEWYPASRVTYRWAFARSYRIGATDAKMQVRRGSRGTVAPGLLWLATKYSVRGVLRLLLRLPHPPTAFASCGWDISRGAGLVSGLIGVQYDEYRTVHGE